MRCMSACGSILLSLLACVVSVPAAVAQNSGGSYSGGSWTGPYFSSVGNTIVTLSTTTSADRNTTITSSSWAMGPTSPLPFYLPGYYYAVLNGDQCLIADGSGTYTVSYIYKNYYTGQQTTPPILQSKMYLKEVSAVSWFASGYNAGPNGSVLIKGEGDANNGRKDPVVVNADQTGGTSGGTHLVQQDGSSGLVQFNVSPSATAKLNLFGMLNARGDAGTIFNYQWQADTRSVTIVCTPLETGGNFHKGASNLPEANVRNSDGSMTVDSILTAKDDFVAKTWHFTQPLTAPTTGFDITSTNFFGVGTLTNTQFDWAQTNSTGSGDILNLDTPNSIADTTGTYDQLPATYNAHVKVTDLRPNLSATAENDYTIRIHAPFENGTQSANRIFDSNEKYPWTDMIEGNSGASVQMVFQQPRKWTLMGQSFNNVAGSFLAGVCGSGALALIAPEATVAAVIADMVFNVIGWEIANSGSPESTEAKPVTGDYTAFTKAISEQQTINANQGNPNLNDMVDCPDDTRIFPINQIDYIAANPQRYWNYGIPKGRCHNGERYIKCTVTGDGYGDHGYLGRQTNYPVIPARHLNDVWEWTVQPLPTD